MQLVREKVSTSILSDPLVNSIDSKTSKIGVIGLGYVGLPLSIFYSSAGFTVLGFDVNQPRVEELNAGRSPIEHISAADIKSSCDNGFKATSDMSRISEVDAIIICVPTPLNTYREPDLSYITETMDAIVPFLRKGQVISLESTTYPGTTEEELKPRIEARGFTIGEDFFLVYSPEREDPGNANFNTSSIPKLCGGVTKSCLEVGLSLYRSVISQVVPVSSVKVAEMAKLLENIHRAVNIGLVNEMKIVADKMNIDIYEVIRAAATKPFGFVPYYPGPGIGGHCIPIDPFYLTWKAREFGVHTRFIELAAEINSRMPRYVVNRLADALNSRGLPIRSSHVLVLGIAYKRNVDDMRESPAVEIMEILRSKGANLSYSDPHVPQFPAMRQHNFDLTSVELTGSVLSSADAVLLTTAHDRFDYQLIAQHAKLIIDTRGVYQDSEPHIVRA